MSYKVYNYIAIVFIVEYIVVMCLGGNRNLNNKQYAICVISAFRSHMKQRSVLYY